MNINYRIDELIILKYSAAGRLAGTATKGTKTQFATFVLFVVGKHFSPGRTQY
ncbi:MAG: hypothetical protein OXI69_12115 [Acidobacteriota bacterium]|nr:hypothetical protein [Acidobacteriota bacterium]